MPTGRLGLPAESDATVEGDATSEPPEEPPESPPAPVKAPETSGAPPLPGKRPPIPRATGRLFLDTRPWSSVRAGGRQLGTTPIINAELPAGWHMLRLVDADGRQHRRRVQVKAGQATKLFLRLRDDGD
jgi:hypothetical protein